MLSSVIWGIVVIGPYQYAQVRLNHNRDGYDKNDLQFFDCYGPLMAYALATLTIIVWCCHLRVLIGPKEHLLLYHKLLVHRPTRKYTLRGAKETDWAALTNLSQAKLMDTFTFAYRKGFLQLRYSMLLLNALSLPFQSKNVLYSTPRGGLLSMRHFSCKEMSVKKTIKVWISYIVSIIIFLGTLNLENIENGLLFIGQRDGEKRTDYYLRMIYCASSHTLSSIFLLFFIILWETMIDRMSRQRETVKTLSNLIIRNTDSEYIEFDYIDNVLSWLALEDFIKRRGMLLFSSMETPLFTLFVQAVVSVFSVLYCIFGGHGLAMFVPDSLFSNSALAVWFYLAVLSIYQVGRMLWQGHKFHTESKKHCNGMESL